MNKYFFVTLKRYIEQVIMFPFIVAGKTIALITPLGKEYDFFLFFPVYGIGGAEKVNGDIVDGLSDKQIMIFFTRKSPDDKLLYRFQGPNITTKDISKWTDNKFMYWANLVYRGICARYINVQKKRPVVFNGQCNFAYKLFPHLSKKIRKVELIHNSNLTFAKVTFPYIPFIDKRVMFADSIIATHISYYRSLGIPETYEKRIVKIVNSVFVPEQFPVKKVQEKLKIYYAGRGGYQKHLELLFEIITGCIEQRLPVEFHLAGTFEDEIPASLKPAITWHGSISSQDEIYKMHREMNILVMTSRFEGFPLVIMEAMSCGVAIISTAVDGIPEHIKDGENGFLMKKLNDSDIVADGIGYIRKFIADPELLHVMARNNYEYAKRNFAREVFVKAYRNVLVLSD